MQIYVTAAAMISGEVEYDFDPLHRGARYSWLAQIRFREGNAAVLEMRLDVLEPAAGEIVDHVHARSTLKQRIHKMRTDKRCTARHKYFFTIPDGDPHSSRLQPLR